MFGIVLLGSSLLAGALPADTDEVSGVALPSDLQHYQAARAEVGRDPDAHVRLALWCESRGLTAERAHHLAMAVLTDPTHAAARALMGVVEYRGKWRNPEDVAKQVEADAALSSLLDEYSARRVEAPDTATAHWKLALWCEERGLEDQGRAHLFRVVRLEPARETAWKRLGYKKVQGNWATDEQLARAKEFARLQDAGDRRWKPLLETWKSWLGRADKREEAERLLAGVEDPFAARSVMAVFAGRSAADQLRAVQLLGQIDAPAASLGIAQLAVFSPSADVRRIATETLLHRDSREFAGPLVELVRKPMRYEVRPVGGPGSPGMLYVEGEQFDVRRAYSVASPPPPTALREAMPGENLRWGQDGLPYWVTTNVLPDPALAPIGAAVVNDLKANPGDASRIFRDAAAAAGQLDIPPLPFSGPWEAVGYATRDNMGGFYPDGINPRSALLNADILNQELQRRATLDAQGRLNADIQWVERTNAAATQLNDRAIPVLQAISGLDVQDDPAAWRAWRLDQLGLQATRDPYQPRPVFDQMFAVSAPYRRPSSSCFGAGTLVWTRDGRAPIEAVQVGDLVLSQDPQSGALGYQPVVAVRHNRPSTTFRVTIGDESIVSTPIHRFWVAGRGWVMARDLEVGDEIRTVGGVEPITAIDAGEVQSVFNLEVPDTRTFFVGAAGSLVHDASVPSTRLAPFDAPPALAVAAAE